MHTKDFGDDEKIDGKMGMDDPIDPFENAKIKKGRIEEIGTLELGGGAERAMDNTLDNFYYAASTPRLQTFEAYYNNYGGFGRSPRQLMQPFLTFDRLPNFHAYVRHSGKDLRIPYNTQLPTGY